MKHKIGLLAILMIAAAAFAFANGNQEHGVSIPGTLVSVSNGANGSVNITVVSDGKNYTATLSARTASKLNLTVGKEITLKGTVGQGKETKETEDVRVSSVEVDGNTVVSDDTDSNRSKHSGVEVSDSHKEKSDSSPDHNENSSVDN
ncbi:hypothetical protein [Salinispira pacifica]